MINSASYFTAPGTNGPSALASPNRASTYNTGDSQYPSNLNIGAGGVGATAYPLTSQASGGNGFVVITPITTALPTTFNAQFSNGLKTYVVPTGVTTVLAKLWGAGGAGGSIDYTGTLTGSGGGAGGYTQVHKFTKLFLAAFIIHTII